MTSRSLLVSLALLALLHSSAQAQTAARPAVPARSLAVPIIPGAQVIPAQPGQTPAAGAAKAAPGTPAAVTSTAAKTTRVQAVNKLKIDRRPSKLLEAWAEERKRIAEEANAKEEKEETKEDGKDEEKEDGKDEKKEDGKPEVTKPATPTPPANANPFAEEMASLEKQILLGQWDDFAKYLDELEDENESFQVYRIVLTKLAATPPSGSVSSAGRAYVEKNRLGLDDVHALLTATPKAHDDASLSAIGRLLSEAVRAGNTLDPFLELIDAELKKEAKDALVGKRQVAKLMRSAGYPLRMGGYLPSIEEATKEDDAEALNLLSELALARYRDKSDQTDLEEAWRVIQLVLESESADEASQQRALTQAVSLSSTVRKELGQDWLDNSFAEDAERGMRILTTVGKLTSQGLSKTPTSPSTRTKNMKLLSTSVEVLIENAPEKSKAWRETLTLLALPWLKESELAYRLDNSGVRGPLMRYDSFGNPYFMNASTVSRSSNMARPITVAELLKHRPSDKWIALLDVSMQPRFEEWLAKLFLKVQEEENAFPYIEKLAASQPDIAKKLVNEFLTVWANNHDPNRGRRMQSPIFRIYGFSQRAEGIPLTRSQQERNLGELSKWLERLRALPIADEMDERLLVRAFTVCHSSAEVYDINSIRNTFGEIDSLEPATIAELVQKMRTNLSGLWREPDVQKQNQTNRRKKDIEAEVLRGYDVATKVIDDALTKHEDNWSLMLAKAALLHDEVNYRQEVAKSSKFTEQRVAAVGAFRDAASAYAKQVAESGEEKESIQLFQLWFNASLGACDLRQLASDQIPLLKEPAMIREAILAMPPDIAERHMAKFANSLFTSLRSVGPAVKFRYLRNGFKIVGDHERAVEAKKVFDYYDDLVTEIELQAVVDGTTNVGHEQPFGIFINLRHTREIERESGGFGRYLQNQNNVQYSYNYGRPTENYRDKFEEGLRAALSEHFEVESVTFQTEDVTSKADKEYGWRTTSYAYVLAKARGEEVDRIPPIKMDLDFLETTGYVVIPIESPMVPIDAGAKNADPRPVAVQSIVQTLDERQAKDGKLILEVKAAAHGLVPELDKLVDVKAEGFEVAAIDDQGVAVSRFDPDAEDTVVTTERLWTITLEGRDDLAELPKEFTFASLQTDAKESLFQRYSDADLESVEQTIELGATYGKKDNTLLVVMLMCLGIVMFAGVGVAIFASRKTQATEAARLHLPDEINPFTVIGVLREIHQNNGLSSEQKAQLEKDIHRLEGAYFAPEAKEDEDLRNVAEGWLRRARV